MDRSRAQTRHNRVLCVDLNLDGYDEILVTRTESSSLIVLENVTGQ